MRHQYTPEQEELIWNLHRQGYTSTQIAKALGPTFTSAAIRNKIQRIRFKKATEGDTEPATDLTTLRNRIKELEAENEKLRVQLERLMHSRRIQTAVHKYQGEWIRFGVVSDTHLGSSYAALDHLQLAYRLFKQEGIEVVYHVGDLLDGEKIYRGQEYDLLVHGAEAQIQYCVEHYPRLKGITTYFILGNHDMSFWKQAGVDVGVRIEQLRDDMKYLGMEHADIKVENENGQAWIQLVHPRRGTAYSLSYHPQKYIEALPGGRKPNLILWGHNHKAEFLFYRNVHLIQAGCLQHQTPYMRGKNIAAIMGFWIVGIKVDEKGIIACRPQFYPIYEEPLE